MAISIAFFLFVLDSIHNYPRDTIIILIDIVISIFFGIALYFGSILSDKIVRWTVKKVLCKKTES